MEESLDLDGRTALVTGATRNIGRAISLEFARHGATLVLNGLSDQSGIEGLAHDIETLGGHAEVVMGDASQPETIARLEKAATPLGGVDISVSNAARRLWKTFFETTDEDWHRHLNMQLTASWYLAKAFGPGMSDRGWGRIIHINGPDGWYGGHRRLPHATAKGGLRTFTKALARELGGYGVTVNDVVPGFTATVRDPVTHPQIDEAFTRATIEDIPIGRLVEVEEIAWACLFLASRRSAGITGAAIHVDGGHRMLG